MKHIHRFFVQSQLTPGVSSRLEDDDIFHAARVLRLKTGDPVEIADGRGQVYEAVIAGIARGDGGYVEVVPEKLVTGPSGEAKGSELIVVQALPGGRKMDQIVEKLSEIGVASLVPVVSNKSVARGGRSLKDKTDRWRRVAKAAAIQSKRTRVMPVAEPVELMGWLAGYEGTALVLATEVQGSSLGQTVSGFAKEQGKDKGLNSLTLMVGPEAGFSKEELKAMQRSGFRFVSLGPLVLRTETAALVAATLVMHRLGAIG